MAENLSKSIRYDVFLKEDTILRGINVLKAPYKPSLYVLNDAVMHDIVKSHLPILKAYIYHIFYDFK